MSEMNEINAITSKCIEFNKVIIHIKSTVARKAKKDSLLYKSEFV